MQVELGIGEQVWVLSPSVGTHPWVGKEAEVCRGWAAGGFNFREALRSGYVLGGQCRSSLLGNEVCQVSAEPLTRISLAETPALQPCDPAQCQTGCWGVWDCSARHGLGEGGLCDDVGGCLFPQVRKRSLGRKGRGELGLFPAPEQEGCSWLGLKAAPRHPHMCGPSGPQPLASPLPSLSSSLMAPQ